MILRNKYINIRYEDLSPEQLQELMDNGILNGFGGARQSYIVRFFIGLVLHNFSIAIADKHDYGYWLGVTPRKECDDKFFIAMTQDCLRIYEKTNDKLLLAWNFSLSFLAYLAIRIFGWQFYNKSV